MKLIKKKKKKSTMNIDVFTNVNLNLLGWVPCNVAHPPHFGGSKDKCK
jgi:hypothetical protein